MLHLLLENCQLLMEEGVFWDSHPKNRFWQTRRKAGLVK